MSTTAIKLLEREVARLEKALRFEKKLRLELQAALSFWLPNMAGDDPEIIKAIDRAIGLLYSDEPINDDTPSAQERGWITLNASKKEGGQA